MAQSERHTQKNLLNIFEGCDEIDMWIDPIPFPYLKQEQFAGLGDGEIYFLDKTIPEEKKNWLREKYKSFLLRR